MVELRIRCPDDRLRGLGTIGARYTPGCQLALGRHAMLGRRARVARKLPGTSLTSI